MSGVVYPLQGNQALAVDPLDSVWLSASAGTGKTQVLSARVLRLLLQEDVAPSQILCLTFTKAGAAEMANRVNDVLARWVRMPDELLAKDLAAIGAAVDDGTRARARSRFAAVLDCPGGGLRIDTIHAFSQWLLSAFPEEAGLVPGTRAMEDRDRALLAQEVLSRMMLDWEAQGERELRDAMAMLSLRMGPDGARSWLMRCAEAREVWFGPSGWPDDLETRVRQLLGLASDAGPEAVEALCGDDAFDIAALRRCIAANSEWGTKTGLASAEAAEGWLSRDKVGRAATIDDLATALFTQKRDPRSLKSLEKIAPAYAGDADAVLASLDAVRDMLRALALVALLTPALRVGRRFALRWDEAKAREGLIDFDDQIRRAAALLTRSNMADWIAFKLDRRFDHILIDEAQDTNEAQWSIVKALTGEYFAGAGQRDGKMRTVFVVGDYKQAIFRFQGTSPENFEAARRYFDQQMADASAAAGDQRGTAKVRPLQDLGLGRSYRTSQPVLDFVDQAIAAIGADNLGLSGAAALHEGEARPGQVVLWQPIGGEDGSDGEPEGEEGWISAPERQMADRIADEIAGWLDPKGPGFALAKGKPRRANAGDIMVLVRKRRELAGLIVARLYARGIPVAGVDRLRLGAPLAVKDLMAALRFAAQPRDDLSLACLLVSPLLGWTQEDLLAHAYRPDKVALWDHLRASEAPLVCDTVERLRDLLRRADVEPVQALLHWLLVGPWAGRRKLVARLGQEANDPINELLNAADAFDSAHSASLAGFIQWFDASDDEVKREAGASEGLVRVMTVHGSKGLQAPIVILADATGNPDNARARGLTLEDGAGQAVPLPALREEERTDLIEAVKAGEDEADRQEHWRLLYVAMTRAEEALFIGGALGAREKEPAADSWYARLAPLFEGEVQSDPVWGTRKVMGEAAPSQPYDGTAPAEEAEVPVPAWARQPVGPEPRPPRPLSPSSAAEDDAPDPPLPDAWTKAAAQRGVLIHSLLERLPAVPADRRAQSAARWVARHGADLDEAAQGEVVQAALRVLEDPAFAAVFGPDALAEVPLAATVDGQVIAGIADRLLVEPERVTVIDFKTARRPPMRIEDVPERTLKQMAAYAAALAVIFPGREIAGGLLYTQTPQMIALPADVLAAHHPKFRANRHDLVNQGVE